MRAFARRPPKCRWIAAWCAVIAATSQLRPTQAALQNGDFESPIVPSFPGYQIISGTDISAWLIAVNSSLKLLASSLVSTPSGSQVIDLNGPSGPGIVSQLVATQPGTSYTLSLIFRGNWAYDTGVPYRSMNVRVSTSTLIVNATLLDTSGSEAASVFQPWSAAFVATTSTVTIQLRGQNPGALGALCDAVKLIAASPTPTTFPSASGTATQTVTASVLPSLLPSASETPSNPPTPTATPSRGSSASGTATVSLTGSVTVTSSRTQSPTITISRSFSGTRSATASRTAPPSPTTTVSASPRYAGTGCASCPVFKFVAGAPPPGPPSAVFAGVGFYYFKVDAASNPAFAGATHMEIHAWGSGGAGAFAPGGAGAFVTGILPLNSRVLRSQTLLRFAMGDRGGGGQATAELANASQTAGGGRTAIQIVGDDQVTWVDVVSVGGGGGASCSRPGLPGLGSSFSRVGVASPQSGAANPLYPCAPLQPQCSIGLLDYGASTDADIQCDAGGGGGYCGGLSAGRSGLGGGGGSSDASALLCSLAMDGGNAGVPYTFSPYYIPGTAGSGSFAAGQPGAVVIIPLNFSVASAVLRRCSDDSLLRNPTPSCTAAPAAPATTPSPSASRSASVSASRSRLTSASVTASASAAASPTRGAAAVEGLLPPQLPAALLTCDVVAAASASNGSAASAVSCSGCSPGYYLTGPSSCALCPSRSAVDTTTLLLPALRVAGGVLAFGVLAFALVYIARRRKGGTLVGGLQRGLVFAVWAAMLLQIIAAVGASAPATLPAAIRGFYSAVNVFAFDSSAAGAIPPACDASDPFAFPRGVLAAPLVLLGLLIATLPFTCSYWAPAATLRRVCCSKCSPDELASKRAAASSHSQSAADAKGCACDRRRCASIGSSVAGAIVRLCVLGLGIAYSPAATSVMALLDCRTLVVSSDALFQLDGGSSLVTSGSSSSSALVSVSVLRSQPQFVCWSSARHSAAAGLAIAVLVVYLLAWALLTAIGVPLGFRAALAAAGSMPDSAWLAAARADAEGQAAFVAGTQASSPTAAATGKSAAGGCSASTLQRIRSAPCSRACAACISHSPAAKPLRWCAVWCCGLGKASVAFGSAMAKAADGKLGNASAIRGSLLAPTGSVTVSMTSPEASPVARNPVLQPHSTSANLTAASAPARAGGAAAAGLPAGPLARAARRTALSAVLPAVAAPATVANLLPPFAGAAPVSAAVEERRASLLPPPNQSNAEEATRRGSSPSNRRSSTSAAAAASASAATAAATITDPAAAARAGVGLAAILDAQPPLAALAHDPFLSAFAAGDMRPSRSRFAQLELALLFALAAIPVAFAPPLTAAAAAGKLAVLLLVLLAAAAATALQRPYVLAWQTIVRVAALLVSALGAILNYLGVMAGIDNASNSNSNSNRESINGFATFVFVCCIALLVLLLVALVLTLFDGAGREAVAIRVAKVQAEAAAAAAIGLGSSTGGRKSGTGDAGNSTAMRLSQISFPQPSGTPPRGVLSSGGGGAGRRSMAPTSIGAAAGFAAGAGGGGMHSRSRSGVASVVAAAPYRSAAAAAAASRGARRREAAAAVDLGDDAAALERGAGRVATDFGALSRKASGVKLAGHGLRSASKVRTRR